MSRETIVPCNPCDLLDRSHSHVTHFSSPPASLMASKAAQKRVSVMTISRLPMWKRVSPLRTFG